MPFYLIRARWRVSNPLAGEGVRQICRSKLRFLFFWRINLNVYNHSDRRLCE
jgi:hypothetical protein